MDSLITAAARALLRAPASTHHVPVAKHTSSDDTTDAARTHGRSPTRTHARVSFCPLFGGRADINSASSDLCVPKTSSECDAVMESPKLAG